MPDPVTLSLAAVSSLALTEGVKFFYAQAGELLKWWRDRRDANAKAQQSTKSPTALPVTPPAVIAGGSFTAKINPTAIDRFEEDLRGLRKDLSEYAAGGVEVVDVHNINLVEQVDALRRILETAYGHPLTFVGETRTESGPALDSEINIQRVAGYVAGIRAKSITAGTMKSKITADEAAAGSKVIGIKVGQVGPSSSP